MKTAIIYYSYDGNCARTAELMKAALNASVFEIKTVDTKRRKGFYMILWGVLQVMRKKKPALQSLTVDISAYDLIILGTPVWAGAPAPAIASFLDGTKISGKKIALFCCHRGGPGDVFKKFRAMLQGNTIAGEIDFFSPPKGGMPELQQKIDEWVKLISQP